MRRLTVLGAVVLGLWLVTEAAQARSPASTTKSAASTTAARPHLSDAELQSKINAKLAKSKVGKDGFTAHVKNGVVTWEGKTDVIQHKGAATRMARTAGALEVVDGNVLFVTDGSHGQDDHSPHHGHHSDPAHVV